MALPGENRRIKMTLRCHQNEDGTFVEKLEVDGEEVSDEPALYLANKVIESMKDVPRD